MDLFIALSPLDRRNDKIANSAFVLLILQLIHNNKIIIPSLRRSAINRILLDLSVYQLSPSFWSPPTLLAALAALKRLARSNIASDSLPLNLSIFASYANLLPPHSSLFLPSFPAPFNHLILNQSLAIIANTLLLHPSSRSSPDLLPALISLGNLAIGRLPTHHQSIQFPSDPLNPDTLFLASRILFLISATPSNLLINLILHTSLVVDLTHLYFLQTLPEFIQNSNSNPNSHSPILPHVLIEHLKLIFNIMVHYPRSLKSFPPNPPLGSCVNPNRDLSSFDTPDPNPNPPTSSTSTQFDSPLNQINPPSLPSNSAIPPQSLPNLSLADGQDVIYTTEPENNIFSGLLTPLVQLFLLEPFPKPPYLKPPSTSFMHCFLNFSPSAPPFFALDYRVPSEQVYDQPLPPLINKLLHFLTQFLRRYDHLDEEVVKKKCQADDVDLDVDLTHLLLLLANLVSPQASGPPSLGLDVLSRRRLRSQLGINDIDRSAPLLSQSNFLGSVLRLMNGASHDSLKISCGRFLCAIFNNEVDFMVSQIGYGPLAGYLMTIGIVDMTPSSKYPPPPNVNPITGMFWPLGDLENEGSSLMTEDEKAQEAERLCSLFERINQNGIIKAADPRQTAVESGKFEEIESSLEREKADLEEREEQQALAELKQYRDRRNGQTG